MEVSMECRSLHKAIFFMLLLATVPAAQAQGIQGTLNGEVKDETGGVIPGATVTVQNVATGDTRTQLTTTVGTFRFENLAIGTYRVSAELTGFKKLVKEDIPVKANQVVDVHLSLE